MKNFRLTLEFDSDDGEQSWRWNQVFDDLDAQTMEIISRTMECVVRRASDEYKAQSKRARALEHRERNGHAQT
jgi:hypothetical protein